MGRVKDVSLSERRGGEVSVASTGSARAFGKVRSVPLTVWACRQCGQFDLVAAEPEALFEHWSAEQR